MDSNGGGGPSLTLDSSDNPHISYAAYTTQAEVRYAYWNGSAWSSMKVDNGVEPGGISLALDSSGNPHISYGDGYDHDLGYAVWDGSTWNIQAVGGWVEGWAIHSRVSPCPTCLA